MKVDAVLIAGTGVGRLLADEELKSMHVPTPFGLARGSIFELGGRRVWFARRHGSHHENPPARVNYRAIAWASRALGAAGCFSTAAVGTVHPDWPVGMLAVCSDFIDASSRNLSLFESEVRHTDFSTPFSPVLRKALLDSAGHMPVTDGAVYLCTNGPRYETPAEVHAFAHMGADVVGMTIASEAIAMLEAAVPYACLAVVTNFAAGYSVEPLKHGDVGKQMAIHGAAAVHLIGEAIKALCPS